MTQSNQPPENVDILIVGAGIIGATLALALSGTGRSVLVVDAGAALEHARDPLSSSREAVHGFDLRVSALTAASQQLFQGLGVWQEMLGQRVCPFRHMTVWDAEGTGRIEFDAQEVHQPALGHIVENSVILSAILQRLSTSANVEVRFGTRIQALTRQGDQHTVTLVGSLEQASTASASYAVSADLVVGADGANSVIRRMTGIPTREWDYQHHALVATVETEKPHGFVARQRFLDSGPLAFLPLQTEATDGERYCSIVWSMVPEMADRVRQLDDETFCSTLAEQFEHQLGRVTAVSRRVTFPLRQRHAKFYVKPGIALVGDAAHTIHPLAGQGANIGLLDVAVLVDELLRAIELGIPAGNEVVLKRYQRRRLGPNLAMMGVMEGFKRLFAQNDIGVRWARNAGMKWLNQIPFVKNEIISQAMGLNIPTPAGSHRKRG